MFLKEVAEFFVNFALEYGLIGLGASMFAESIGIPLASIALQLTAGVLISAGKATFLSAVLTATIGLTIGSIISYYIGYFGSILFKGKNKKKKKKSKIKIFLEKHGDSAVFFAQLFGTTRTFISIPAGAMRIDIKKFILYTFTGGFIYCSFAVGFSMILVKVVRGLYQRVIDIFIKFSNWNFWIGFILLFLIILVSLAIFVLFKLFHKKTGNILAVFIIIPVLLLVIFGCSKKIPEEYKELKTLQELTFKPVHAGILYGSYALAYVEFSEREVIFKGRIAYQDADEFKVQVFNPKGIEVDVFVSRINKDETFEFTWEKPEEIENGIYTFTVEYICKTKVYVDVEHSKWLYISAWKFK